MKTSILLNKLAKKFPKKYAKMNHDFVGLMTGKLPLEVHKILLCLDCDNDILSKIKENNANKGNHNHRRSNDFNDSKLFSTKLDFSMSQIKSINKQKKDEKNKFNKYKGLNKANKVNKNYYKKI